jgi:4a-hydroxytetrahydrobiopterin dehydratase
VLSDDEIRRRLQDLPGWELTPQGIRKTFRRADFRDAIRLVTAVADLAEQANHHPDILVAGYNRVTFTVMTHSEGGVTDKDIALARQIEQVAG